MYWLFKWQFPKPHLWLIRFVGLIVPRRLRADWRQEWEAELRCREALLAEWDRLNWQNKLDLLWRSTSAFWDALWLQPKRWEDEMIQDLRYGIRMLLQHKAFTFVAVLSLALGIGANTAIFSLINTALLKTLPVKDPGQLVLFTVAGPDGVGNRFNFPLIEQFGQNNHSFTGVIATSITARWRMSEPGGEVEAVQATRVSGNYFSVLGVGTVAGRTLLEDDDKASGPQPVAVISYNYWKRRFGLEPGVVGKKVMLDNYPFTIVGVAPAGFFGFEVGDNPDVWLPLRMTPLLPSGNQILTIRQAWVLHVMARLKPGVTTEQARAEMDAVLKQHLYEIAPERAASFTPIQRRNYFERSIRLESGATGFTPLRRTITQPLFILMTIVGLVLLIACANVANLLLSRTTARRKELAVRLALGAGRFRLIRQLLTESVLLAALSGALGLLFARWGAHLLLTYLPRKSSVALDIAFDAQVIGFTLAVSLLAGLLFGVVPALRATRLNLTSALKDTTGGSAGKSRLILHKSLVVAQVALSLCLLIGAGLFVRSLQNLKNLDPGFDRENVVLFELDSMAGFTPARRVSFQQQLFERLEGLPGARAASRAQFSLLSGATNTMRIAVEGQAQRPNEDMICHQLWVGPKFFTTMGIPLLQGRDFNPQELQPPPGTAPGTSLAAVINQTMARDSFGDQNPLGQHFRLSDGPLKGLPIEVIGVAKDTKYASLREQTPRTFYLSFFQSPGDGGGTYMLRTLDASSSAAAIQRTVRELDPQLKVLNLQTMNEVVDDSLLQERFVAQIGGFFSLSALLLACIGLYGVMSYATTRRTREIGIRMALGASRSEVLNLVLNQGLRLVLVGVMLGLLASLAVTQAMKNMLFGLRATDPATYAVVTMLLTVVALLACYLPARRATKVDPLAALRHD
jgi:predicted permease